MHSNTYIRGIQDRLARTLKLLALQIVIERFRGHMFHPPTTTHQQSQIPTDARMGEARRHMGKPLKSMVVYGIRTFVAVLVVLPFGL